MLTGLLPSLFMLVFMFTVGFSSIWIVRRKQRGRRSPFTQQLLRGPGESLRIKVDDLNEGLNECLVQTFVIPLAFCIAFLLQTRMSETVTWLLLGMYVLTGVLVSIFLIRRMVRLLEERNIYRLGLDAEIAVGQELNQLMAYGCRVFHDVQAENFNIDHVVVGPSGVYAVETKGRSKPDKGRGSADAKVIYDGEVLQFPDWQEPKPIAQAKRQAVWLGKWLTSAVGSSVSVIPALALPGWFVERSKPGEVIVFNGKNPLFLAKPNFRGSLNEQQVQQIAHQLEQRCRDVAPSGYKKKSTC
jgi:hypothetical protein